MTIATLGGEPLNAIKTISWPIRYGVEPVTGTFEIERARGERILARAQTKFQADPDLNKSRVRNTPRRGPLDLVIHVDNKPKVSIGGLFVIARGPGKLPYTMTITVADSRWPLARRKISRRFNVPRRSGTRRILNDSDKIRDELAPIADDVTFAPWSLKGGTTKWTLRECFVDVLDELVGRGGYRLPATFKRKLPVQNVAFTGQGDAALAILLGYASGYEVYADYNGILVITDARDGSEAQHADHVPYIGTGLVEVNDRSFVRPARIHVDFVREIELRFDYDEDDTAGTALTTVSRDAEASIPLDMHNVGLSVDQEITVDGAKVAQGTWVKIGDATKDGLLKAWAADTTNENLTVGKLVFGSLSQQILRDHYFPAHRKLLTNYSLDVNGFPHTIWSRRISSVFLNWRRTFRLRRRWRDRLLSIRAYRVGIMDPETGTRAPAEAYCDYIVRPTERGQMIKRSASHRMDRGWEVAGYATDISQAVASPFSVSVIDSDQGIIRVVPVLDPYGEGEAIAPGKTTGLPTLDLAAINRDPKAARAFWKVVKLDSGFKLSVILTCIQGAPNHNGQYHRETVSCKEAAAVLGRPVGECNGPDWTLQIGGGLLTAKVGWDDTREGTIRSLFERGGPTPPGLLLNPGQVRDVAKASAARLISLLLDRNEGNYGTSIAPVEPTGSMSSVVHMLDRRGVARTMLIMPPITKPDEIEAHLPISTLNVIRRLVQP